MTYRNLLHKNKLTQFQDYLDVHGIPHRPGRGDWEVLQVQTPDRKWAVIYRRNHMPEHLTVPRPLLKTVLNFLKRD